MIDKMNEHYSMTNPCSVYEEEALTALELVGRTTAKVNELVEQVNQNTEDTAQMRDEQIPNGIKAEMQKYLDSGYFEQQLDLYTAETQQNIINSQEAMAQDMAIQVQNIENDLGARLNNLAQLQDGSTTGDAELIDMRVSVNGYNHPNAGGAVRAMGKVTNPFARLSGGVINYDSVNEKITLLPTTSPSATLSIIDEYSVISNRSMNHYPLDMSQEFPYAGGNLFLIFNFDTKQLFARADNISKNAGDVLLLAIYNRVVSPVSLSPDSVYKNGKPMFENYLDYGPTVLYTWKKVKVDEVNGAITFPAGYIIGRRDFPGANGYDYNIRSILPEDVTLELAITGGVQNVRYNHVTNVIDVVERSHIFTENEHCLFTFFNPMGIKPVSLHPSCIDYKVTKGDDAITTDLYKTVSDMISVIGNIDRHINIVLGGDSITHGSGGSGFEQNGDLILDNGSRQWYRNDNGYCWANLFKQYVESNYNATVTVNGCSGSTSATWNAYKKALIPADTDILILMIGTNDRVSNTLGTKNAVLDSYEGNLKAIVDYCHAQGTEVILLSPIPASAEQEASENMLCTTAHLNNVVQRVASEYRMEYVNLRNAFYYYMKNNNLAYADYMPDGLHPNDAGYRLMYYLLLDALSLAPEHEEV